MPDDSVRPAAFYLANGDVFESTRLTRGPWGPDTQHGGPPAALLGRAIEHLEGGARFRVSRLTVEILKPIPIVPLRVEARLERPGRSVQLASAQLLAGDKVILRASAWRIRHEPGVLDAPIPPPEPSPPGPEHGTEPPFFLSQNELGYHSAMEWRFITGAFLEPGPAVAWLRMTVPLVAGEEPSPLTRVLAAADSGNGISAVADFRKILFVNTDLSVHLSRMPRGEWIGMRATTRLEPHGIGLTETSLFDATSAIGSACQSLFVGRR